MGTVFSDNLKRFRQQKDLTQEQAAEALGVNAHTVSRWECDTTLPDVMMLPQIARLYCVTIDDLFKETSAAYDNYAQRLASVYESTRHPEDFIAAEREFRKLLKSGSPSAEDLRICGVIHQYMMRCCMDRAEDLFDRALAQGKEANGDVYWRTKHQKMSLYAQTGRMQEALDEALAAVRSGSEDPEDQMYLIAACQYSGDAEQAYEWFAKALPRFPEQPKLYVYGGDVCRSLKRYEEAFRCWRRALELDGEMYDARYSMGSCYEELGEYEKAYGVWLEIARDLEQEGYEVEKDSLLRSAEKCRERMEKALNG